MAIEIKGITEASFLDWDGKVVATIYLPRCNFRCPFCHNWELVETPEKYETRDMAKLLAFLDEHRDFLDGVCITGGEPTLYPELPRFLAAFRECGMKVKLDTNGTNPEMLERLLSEGAVDCVAMDVKGPLDGRYDALAGIKVDLDAVRRSISLLMSSGIEYEFRTTVVPGMLGREEVGEIAGSLRGASKFVIQQFVPRNTYSKELRQARPYEREAIMEMVAEASKHLRNVHARGI